MNQEIGLDYVAEHGRGKAACAALRSEVWARGVVDKGSISFVPSFARATFANMPCFYVNAEDTKTGLGVAYASEWQTSGPLWVGDMLILCWQV